MTWDQYFLAIANVVKQKSKDPSTKMGAVIVGPDYSVISVGYNGFPKGMPDNPELYANREEKYSRVIHGEMNALMFAVRPIPQGSSLYTSFLPCDRCTVHMLQSGIRRFVAPRPTEEQLQRWGESFKRTRKYIAECGGELIEL